MGQGGEHGLLHHVLGLGGVEGEGESKAVRRGIAVLAEPGERQVIPGGSPDGQLPFQ